MQADESLIINVDWTFLQLLMPIYYALSGI
jgi:hypothetical protein